MTFPLQPCWRRRPLQLASPDAAFIQDVQPGGWRWVQWWWQLLCSLSGTSRWLCSSISSGPHLRRTPSDRFFVRWWRLLFSWMVRWWFRWQTAGRCGWQEVVKWVSCPRTLASLSHLTKRDSTAEWDDVPMGTAPKRAIMQPLSRVGLLASFHVSQYNASNKDGCWWNPEHRHHPPMNRSL